MGLWQTFSLRLEFFAPGNYRIFSWESLEPYRYFDQEFVNRPELQGIPVRIEESSVGCN